MELLPVDLVSLVATVLGISIVLIPVIGITARFALKPTVEALGKLFETRGAEESMRILERRLDLQEQQIDQLQSQLRAVREGQEFERQLSAPRSQSAPELPGPDSSTI